MKLPLPRLLTAPGLPTLLFVGFAAFLVRWLEMLAVALFAYRITASPLVVAMLTMVRVLPMGLFGAFIGAAADRYDLRRALLLMVAVSLGGTLVLAVLASAGALQIWHLYLAAFVNGSCWAADNSVRRVMIGNAVGPERIGPAISLDVAAGNASRVLGPILAGFVLERLGIAGVFWFGVLLYALSLLAALRIGVPAGPAGAAPRVSFLAEVREGLAWIRQDPRLIGAYLVTVIFNLFAWPYTSMIPVIYTEYFGLPPSGVGLLASSEGIGGLFGAVLFAALARPQWYRRIYVGSVGLYLVAMMGFATAPFAHLATGFLLLGGLTGVGFSIMQATLVYRDAPIEMRARLMGVLSVCIGTSPLGFTYLGFLADLLTPRVATVALAAQGVLALMFTRRYWAPLLRP